MEYTKSSCSLVWRAEGMRGAGRRPFHHGLERAKLTVGATFQPIISHTETNASHYNAPQQVKPYGYLFPWLQK